MKRKVLLTVKMFLLFILCLGIFYVLEYGPTWDNKSKLLKPLLLSLFTVLMLFQHGFKRYMFIFSMICLLFMVVLSIFNLFDLSKSLGSFGFSLLVITMFLYLPQIIKKGYVERF